MSVNANYGFVRQSLDELGTAFYEAVGGQRLGTDPGFRTDFTPMVYYRREHQHRRGTTITIAYSTGHNIRNLVASALERELLFLDR